MELIINHYRTPKIGAGVSHLKKQEKYDKLNIIIKIYIYQDDWWGVPGAWLRPCGKGASDNLVVAKSLAGKYSARSKLNLKLEI